MRLVALLVAMAIMVVPMLSQTPVDNQQPQFHPGPPKNWMNDPNGPMYFKGYYHLFFQYNPLGPSWGHMSWGHIVSKDLAHWKHLPVALSPDMDYDRGGVFTGSATIRDDGTPIIVYTCVGHGQLQCIALPNDTSDPMLTAWHKSPSNPVISEAPPGGSTGQFRDDTSAWKSPDGSWRMVVGASINGTGSASLWKTKDFLKWTYVGILADSNSQKNAGMWECPDFYNLTSDKYGRWVLKYSAGGDWYRLGMYDQEKDHFRPTTLPVKYDFGQFYASKRFYDPVKNRQILYGWSSEEDKDAAKRGWQGHQTLPRSITPDYDTNMLITNPVEELELLRKTHHSISTIKTIAPGAMIPVEGVTGLQLDIVLVLRFAPGLASAGLAVRTSADMKTMTSVTISAYNLTGPLNNTDLRGGDFMDYSYPMENREADNIANCSSTCEEMHMCVSWTYVRSENHKDPRCSLKSDVPDVVHDDCCVSGSKSTDLHSNVNINRTMTGGTGNLVMRDGPLPMHPDDSEFTLRVFVDHSMIEAIAMNGRTAVTAHVYPDASNDGVALINPGKTAVEVVSFDIWEMDSCWVESLDN